MSATPDAGGEPVPEANRDDWRSQARCLQSDPEVFFPEKGGSAVQAKTICQSCDVATQCLAYALENGEKHGIWGGLSPRQRRILHPEAPTEEEVIHRRRERTVMELRKLGSDTASIVRLTGLQARTIYRIINRAAGTRKGA